LADGVDDFAFVWMHIHVWLTAMVWYPTKAQSDVINEMYIEEQSYPQTQWHPPGGHSGRLSGTSYVVKRFHGVLIVRLGLVLHIFGSNALIFDRKHDQILRSNLLDVALGTSQLRATSPAIDTNLIRDGEDRSRSHRLILSMNYKPI
jgi:hypothetical protein